MAAIPQETLKTLLGRGATAGYVFTYDGARWVARAAAASGLAIVDDDEPADPATGQLWYDTDATC